MARSGLVVAISQGGSAMACSERTIIFNTALYTSATFMGVIVLAVPARVIIRISQMERGNAV